jgi:hypothetical protein
MLCPYLKKKKFLLILDDMWSLELQSLGEFLNEGGSKIVLTFNEIALTRVQGFATGYNCSCCEDVTLCLSTRVEACFKSDAIKEEVL